MELSSPNGVAIKSDPGIQDEDGHVMIPSTYIEIEIPNIKQECLEYSEILDRTDGKNI